MKMGAIPCVVPYRPAWRLSVSTETGGDKRSPGKMCEELTQGALTLRGEQRKRIRRMKETMEWQRERVSPRASSLETGKSVSEQRD